MSRPGKAGGLARRTFLKTAAAGGAGLVVGAGRPARAPGQPKKQTVTLWAHFAGKNYEILTRLIGEFNQATPDVEVKATSYGPAEILPKYLASVAAGAPPDIFHAPGYVPPDLALNKVIAPVDDLVKLDPTTYKNFDPITIYGGRRYGVPVNGGLGVMCYNMELYEKAGLDPQRLPETWDDLIAAARKMTNAAENQWGLMLGNKAGFTTAQVYWTFLLSAGGELISPDGKASAFNSEPGLETLSFLAEAVHKHKVSPHKLYTDVEAWNDWGTRRIGSILLYPVFTANILATRVRSMTKTAPWKLRKAAHFAGNYWTISSLGKNKEAVARFCQWWVQPAVSGRWAGESGALPNSQAAADHPSFKQFLAQNPLGQAFLDTIPFARPFPGVVGLPAVIQIVSEMVESAVVGGVAPRDALAKAATRADQELKRAQKA
ncbi:MAG TPA: extracellular solute-binding protein [Methylomirabilota bacterium]|jgi:multiple sugar transport system substrate-binding protein|nr:extracellular solute-binding protein [Methylomirabilota bacterium]